MLTKSPQGKKSDARVIDSSRRRFLAQVGSLSLVTTVVASSCVHDSYNPDTDGVNLGSGDVGILNYAYALEQLEAAFYTQVVASPYSGMSAAELSILTDVRDHEIAHREFFKAALGSSAIPGLAVNFASINFADRTSVLGTAKAFEDLGVSAYNGAGQLIQSAAYLTLAGKIVSVEARHAAAIRELIAVNSFADNSVLDTNSLDMARLPPAVLAIAGTYVATKINASYLPS